MSDIPVSSTDFTIYAPGIGTLSYMVSFPRGIYPRSMQMVEHSIEDHLYSSLRCYSLFCFYFMVLVHDFIGMLKVDYLSSIACLMYVL